MIVLGGVGFGIASIPDTFAHIQKVGPDLLTLHADGYDTTFFLTAVIVTSIGAGMNTFPHLWPPIFAAENGAVLRNNYVWLAIYQLVLFAPILVGMTAIQALASDTTGNDVLLNAAQATLPQWLVAVVAIAGAAAAMVPAAAIAMGISTLVSRNLIVLKGVKAKMRMNRLRRRRRRAFTQLRTCPVRHREPSAHHLRRTDPAGPRDRRRAEQEGLGGCDADLPRSGHRNGPGDVDHVLEGSDR